MNTFFVYLVYSNFGVTKQNEQKDIITVVTESKDYKYPHRNYKNKARAQKSNRKTRSSIRIQFLEITPEYVEDV